METRSISKSTGDDKESQPSTASQKSPEILTPKDFSLTMEPGEVKIKTERHTVDLSDEELAAIMAMRIPPLDPCKLQSLSAQITKARTLLKTETKTFDLKTLVKDKFTLTSVNNKQRFEELNRILRSNGLYPLATKTRTIPIFDAVLNPTGYTEETAEIIDNRLVITPADSVSHYAHDLDRLETIMHTAFDKALYHQSQGFIDHDPVQMYSDLRTYFHGQDSHGINAARAALSKFRINTATSLRADIALFEEAIKNQEYATQEQITERLKCSIIDEKFSLDTRIGVRERLTYCQCSEFTYAQTMKALKNVPNASVVPNSQHRLLALQPTTKKAACNNFAKGKCTFGDKCRYSHDTPPKTTTIKALADAPPTGKAKDVASDKPHNKPKAPFPNYISEKHRSLIGPPQGLISPTNPIGLSRKQHVVLKHIQAYDTDGDWNLPGRGGRDSNGNEYMNMFTATTSSSTSPPREKNYHVPDPFSPPPPSDCIHLQYHDPTPPLRSGPYISLEARQHQPPGPGYDYSFMEQVLQEATDEDEDDTESVPFNPTSPPDILPDISPPRTDTASPPNELAADVVKYIKGTIKHFIEGTVTVYAHCTRNAITSPSLKGYISYEYFKLQQGYSTEKDTYTRSVNIFGWRAINTLRQHHEPSMLHVYMGDPHLLELLNVLGNAFLHAHTSPRALNDTLSIGSYNSFSPFAIGFNSLPSKGAYRSSIITIGDYVHYYKQAADIDVHSPTRAYLILTIIYDFMAFTSAFYRASLQDHAPHPQNMAKIRDILITTLLTMTHKEDLVPHKHLQEFSDLLEIFIAVAENAAPTPVTQPDGTVLDFTTPAVSRKRAQEPPSVLPTPSESVLKRARYSHGKDDDYEDEGDAGITPDTFPRPASSVIDLSQPRYPTIPAPEDLHDADDINLRYFATIPMNALSHTETTFIMDSGAGRTGTADLSLLRNVKPNLHTTVNGAFGPAIKPTHVGQFGPHKLDAVYIKSMGPQTLVSLSQFCNAGNQFIGVFTPTEYRMYDLQSALPALNLLTVHGKEAERGAVRNGIYVRS
jgi:hypothetical protein